MVQVLLLSADSRLTFQVEGWLKELAREVKFEKHSSLEDLTNRLASPQDAAVASESSVPGNEKQIPLRLVIVDLDLLHSHAPSTSQLLKWMRESKTAMRPLGTADVPPRFLALGFEGSSPAPQDLCDEAVDDLILKPLDRSLFLQKVEVLIADTPKVKPSFLFRQKTELMIEAGKDVVVEEISEFGVAFRSRYPLAEGIYGAIHCKVLGEGADNRVISRVYASERHPAQAEPVHHSESDYLVRASFFGISSAQLAEVKKFVRARQTALRSNHSAHHGHDHSQAGKAHPVAAHKPVRIAVIDMNRDNFTELKSALLSNFRDVSVRVFPSYARLLRELARLNQHPHAGASAHAPSSHVPAKTAAKTPTPEELLLAEIEPPVKKPAFPKGERLGVIMAGGSYEVVRFDPPPPAGEPVLGHEAKELLERADLFRSSIEKDDRDEFEEFVAYVENGAKGHAVFRVRDAEGALLYLEAKGELAKAGDADGAALLHLELTEIDEQAWHDLASVNHAAHDASAFRFDAIFIDGAMLRAEAQTWLDSLLELLHKAGVRLPSQPHPKIFFMATEHSRLQPEAFRLKGITDFFYKQGDRKYLVQKIHALIPQLERLDAPDASAFVPCEFHAKLAKNVRMSELAEYGLTIIHPAAIREKTFLRFFSPVFGDHPDGVIGRCTSSEKLDKDHGFRDPHDPHGHHDYYQCHFNLFGPSEELLARIRNWIREDYVHKKDGSS